MKKSFLSGGFTLLEILLAVSILVVITGISIPVFRSLQIRNDTEIAVNTIVQSLRRAQTLSQAVDGDSQWGVKVQPGSIVLFKGSTYAGRVVSFDETFDLPGTIAPSGVTEIIFSKLTGFSQNTGNLVLTAVNSNKTIAINEKGTLEY